MKITCMYDTLVKTLVDVAGVVDDSVATEDSKMIVFIVRKSGVSLIGMNQYVRLRKPLDAAVELEEDEFSFQLRSKELMGFLNSYKSVRCTKVDSVTFESLGAGKIRCLVQESYTDAEIERQSGMGGNVDLSREFTSAYVFMLTPIRQSLLAEMGRMVYSGEELTTLDKVVVQWHTRNLLPLLQSGTSAYGHMVFIDDNVVVQSPAFFTVMKSMVADGGIFTGMRMSQKSVAMLDRFLSQEACVEAAKMQNMVYLRSNSGSELFLMYDNGTLMYKNQLALAKKDCVVTVDRTYFKDVLKRLSLSDESVRVHVDVSAGVVSLSNSKFSQDICFGMQRGFEELGNMSFRMLPDVISSAIIGSDADFVRGDVPYGGDVFIYYTATAARKGVVMFSDASGMWLSLAGILVD